MTDILQNIGSFTVGLILPTLFVFTLVVFVHELGHFLVARWCGVSVKIFSIGFGPELVGFTDRRGTRWRLSAIPLGGYVKFLGDENAASAAGMEAIAQLPEAERSRTFLGKRVGQRAAIVAAGPLSNFVLAIAIFTVMFAVVGREVSPAIVDAVLPDTPAEAAGFLPGDVIVAIDGRRIDAFTDFQRIVSVNADTPLMLTVDRGGTEIELVVTPRGQVTEDRLGNTYRRGLIGIEHRATEDRITLTRYPPLEALGRAVGETWFVIDTTLDYIGRLFTGRESLDQIGGPITVARVAEQAASLGFVTLLTMAALISISIGFLNLMPVPLLDGGHLAYYAFEAIRRRPLSDRVQEMGFRVGLVVILLLVVVALRNDLMRLFS